MALDVTVFFLSLSLNFKNKYSFFKYSLEKWLILSDYVIAIAISFSFLRFSKINIESLHGAERIVFIIFWLYF